jgi:hypothetical protein
MCWQHKAYLHVCNVHCLIAALLYTLRMVQVKKVEAYGSSSGRTSKKVVVADCGQIS